MNLRYLASAVLLTLGSSLAIYAAAESCDPGFTGLSKTIMALPYAVATVFMTVVAVLYMVITGTAALLSLVGAIVVGMFELFLFGFERFDGAMWFFESATSLFVHSISLFEVLVDLEQWYNGTC